MSLSVEYVMCRIEFFVMVYQSLCELVFEGYLPSYFGLACAHLNQVYSRMRNMWFDPFVQASSCSDVLD